MVKVLIPNNDMKWENVNISKNDSCIIIANKEDIIPVSIIDKLLAAKVKIEFVENKNAASIAFLLGKISEKEKISEVLTDIPDIANLFGKTPAQKKRNTVFEKRTLHEINSAPTVKEKTRKAGNTNDKNTAKDNNTNFEESMNPPEETTFVEKKKRSKKKG